MSNGSVEHYETDLLGCYVARRGTEQPVGFVESDAMVDGKITCHVRWGISDGRTYREDIPIFKLSRVPKPVQPEDIQKRQLLEAGGKIIEEE